MMARVLPLPLIRVALVAALSAAASIALSGSVAADPRVGHSAGLATKKEMPARQGDTTDEGDSSTIERPLLATLVQTHTDERVLVDAESPSGARFDALLADRVTGAQTALDPRLLDLLRHLVVAHVKDGALPRIELVSGFRSPKLNEMLRKKGHHVASHSQHSLGHACDFRIVEDGAERGVDPRELARAIRAAGWTGGIGTYVTKDDWFVHADVGALRSWSE
jgi:uncharacterized protein YcbK (DUF882 family)